jgi:hypothetical protein
MMSVGERERHGKRAVRERDKEGCNTKNCASGDNRGIIGCDKSDRQDKEPEQALASGSRRSMDGDEWW